MQKSPKSKPSVKSEAGLQSDLPTIPTTSQTNFPNGASYEAARRSVTKKRPVAELDDEPSVDAQEAQSGKRRKTMNAPETTVDENEGDVGGGDDSETDEEEDDDGPSQIEAGPRVSSALPKAANMYESDEEVTVKPKKSNLKSSPQVIIDAQRKNRNTRNSASKTPNSTPSSSLAGKPPKVLVSNIDGDYGPKSALTKFMTAQGLTVVDAVLSRHTNFVCVVKDSNSLLKTSKVLRSLALGKKIVTERWLIDSQEEGELLDPAAFIHPDVADSMDAARGDLFSGRILFFTEAAVREYKTKWNDMKALLKDAGASEVKNGYAGKGGTMVGRTAVIYIGTKNDRDASALISEYGRDVYDKEFIKDTIVSGVLDLDDDTHKLVAGATTLKAKAKKTGRRS